MPTVRISDYYGMSCQSDPRFTSFHARGLSSGKCRRVSRWLDKHAKDYDIIDIHGLWSHSTWIATRAARRAGVPYLVRPAGMLSPYTWSRGRLKKRVYWTLIERRTIQAATAFHVTSDEEAEEVRRVRPDARIFVIPNGVEPAAFAAPSDNRDSKARFGPLANGAPVLLFLSRLHPKKGIVDRLLPAVAAMRSRTFLAIVGAEDAGARLRTGDQASSSRFIS